MRSSWDDLRRALASRSPARLGEQVSERAAVALILRESGPGLEILFIRRAEHPEDPWSGQMAFPGGRAEAGDSDLTVTAVRETAEEVGVDLAEAGELLGALDEVRAMARGRPMDLAIAPFVFRLQQPAPMKPGPEVRSVHWIPLDELLGGRWRSTFEYVHQGARLELPCLRFEDLVIWGLTYRMFSSLQSLLDAAAPGASEAARG